MDSGLAFPIELVFLMLVLPIGFVYLVSVAGVATMFARKAWKKLLSRMRSNPSIRSTPRT